MPSTARASRRSPLAGRPLAALLGPALLALAASGCSDRGETLGPGGSDVPPPFVAAATCGGCHPQHLEEWERSMHAFGGVDPVMEALAELAANDPGAKIGEDCLDCHAPSLVRQERWLASLPPNADPVLEDVSQDGVSCDVCHSIDIVPPIGSIDFLDDVDPSGDKLAGISNPVPNPFHGSRVDNSFRTSVQCAPCHQVNLDDGTGIENTYVEWEESILSGMGIECQDCHMRAYTGPAALGGPDRTVHRHDFPGVGYAWEPFRGIDRDVQKDAIRTLLRNAVLVEMDAPASATPGATLPLSIEVTNAFGGHSIPSGTSFAREMWLDVAVRDGADAELWRTGALAANDDLIADADLVKFGSVLYDADGAPTLFTWRAVSIDESGLLPHGESRTASWSVPVPAGVTGPLQVEARLRFRPLPPSLLREIDLERLLPVEVFDMWEESATIPLAGP